MKIIPFEMDPSLYRQSSRLGRPSETQTLNDLIQRVRRFSRDSMIAMGAQMLWHIWRLDPSEDDPSNRTTRLIRSYATHVLSLGAFYCAPVGRPDVTELDFRLLCNEFHKLPEYSKRTIENLQSELVERLQGCKRPRISAIPNDEAQVVFAYLSMARTVRTQAEGFVYYAADLLRQFIIFQEFYRKLTAIESPSAELLEKQIFGMPHLNFIRCTYCIYTLILQSEKDMPKGGFFNFDNVDLSDIEHQMEISADDLKLAANRLSTPITHARSIGAELRKDQTSPQFTLADWLNRRPLIDLDDPAYSTHFGKVIAPSPWKLLGACGKFLTFEFADEVNRNHPALTVYKFRGEAFEVYLEEAFIGTDIHRIGEIAGYKGKRPDFEWGTSNAKILIEAKFSLKPNTDPDLASPTSIIETWSRADECIDQASEYAEHLRIANGCPQNLVLIIVTNESLQEEVATFLLAAKKWNLLSNTGISAMWVISTAELEHFAHHWSESNVHAFVSKMWAKLDPSSVSNLFRDNSIAEEINNAPTLIHLKNAWDTIFPGLAGRYPFRS